MIGRNGPAVTLQAVNGSICLRDLSQIVPLGKAARGTNVNDGPFKGMWNALDMTDVSDEEERASSLSASSAYLFTDNPRPPLDANTLGDKPDTSELSTSCQEAFNSPDASAPALSIPVQQTPQPGGRADRAVRQIKPPPRLLDYTP